MKKCVLDAQKTCDNCGLCDRCDLDPSKICDNCFKCLDGDRREYAKIEITDVLPHAGDGQPEDSLPLELEWNAADFRGRPDVVTLYGVRGRRKL